jgi:pimeloyl-ACP methyl ester carboxylesterase
MMILRTFLKALMAGALFAGVVGPAMAAGAGATSMRYVERGHGAHAVIFIHGFGQSADYWTPWMQLLGDCGVHAIAFDLPGFGRSADAPGPYTIPALAETIAQFMQARGLSSATLVGGAMGSTVAQYVALNHPDLTERLVLIATASRSTYPAPRTREAQLSSWRTSATIDGFFFAKKPPKAYAGLFYEAFDRMNRDAGVEADTSNQNWSTYERLGEITAPTLIIQGAEDHGKSPAEGARMVEKMHDARLVVLENASHTPQWDQPAAFTDAALPFILASQPEERARRCLAHYDAKTFRALGDIGTP